MSFYKFGLQAPTENAELVHNQMRAGRLVVPIQEPIYCKQACGSDSRLRIENVPDRKNRPAYEGVWNILRLRVGSNERDPVFAAWPMKMHRPLPHVVFYVER